MDETKPWYASKGIWGGIIAILSAILGAFGYTLGPDDMQALSALGMAIGAGIGSVMGIYGRVKASKKVG